MRNLKLYFLRFNKEETGKFESGSLEATKGVEINDNSGVVSWSYPKIALRIDSYRIIEGGAYYVTDSSVDEGEVFKNLKDMLLKEYSKEINLYTELRDLLVKFK